ncbi:unnamed protein product [Clavelina lepadiformis]|uniref:Prolactin regulatory element-binding protein n=1 Tax=Clavelina lepadiformis TaxID=159417 RepID=A0ABP0GIX5_CLALP
MSGICKVNYPLYCCHCLDDEAFVIAGGGGAAKTGVRNSLEVLELRKSKKKCQAVSIDQLETGKYAVMSMSAVCPTEPADKKRCLMALSVGNSCDVYSVTKCEECSNKTVEDKPSLTKRKKGSTSEENSKVERKQGISNYKFNLLHKVESVPEKGFQTAVQLSRDGTLLVTGSSDGHLRAWKVPSLVKIFDSPGHKEDVTDIDISPDGKEIASVSRDGKAFIWDASSGHKTLELHASWNMHMTSRSFKFRNCRFSVVPEQSSRFVIFTSHTPLKRGPGDVTKRSCCITKWARKRDKEGKESGSFLPALVQKTGDEAISAIAVSQNGVFVGVGFMEGSVAIYIAFSLQCAHRVKQVHSIFVTSLCFVNDTEHTRAITGDCDAALLSVSVDCSCHMTKLESRTLFSLWLALFLCVAALVGSSIYLHSVGLI